MTDVSTPPARSDRHFVDLSRRLLRSVDRDQLLSAVARALCEVSGCDRCLVVDYDPTNGDTHTRAAHGMDDSWRGVSSNAHRYALSVAALRSVGPVLDHEPELAPSPQKELIQALKVRGTIAAVALRSDELGEMGIAYLDRPGHHFEFTVDEATELTRFADLASLIVQHSMLVDRSRALAGMSERSKLAAELHDGVTQQLFAAGLELDGVLDRDDLDPEVRVAVDHALTSVRRGVTQLRRSLLNLTDDQRTGALGDLAEEIRVHLGDLFDRCEIAGELQMSGTGPEPAGDQRTLMRRVVIEGLRNVEKHARATEVRVSIRRSVQWCVIEVEDDGIGDPSKVRVGSQMQSADGGYGLRSLLADARRLGGRAYVERSRHLGGLSLSVSLPL